MSDSDDYEVRQPKQEQKETEIEEQKDAVNVDTFKQQLSNINDETKDKLKQQIQEEQFKQIKKKGLKGKKSKDVVQQYVQGPSLDQQNSIIEKMKNDYEQMKQKLEKKQKQYESIEDKIVDFDKVLEKKVEETYLKIKQKRKINKIAEGTLKDVQKKEQIILDF